MENEPTNKTLNPMLLAVLMLLALIGLGALLVCLCNWLINIVIDDYTSNLFTFGETVAAVILAVLFAATIGALVRSGNKGA